MCNGVGTGASNVGMEYQEENPVAPEGKPKDVNVVILFTPYSYDLLKDYSSWKWMNQYAEVYSHYEYGRFISLLEWDNERKYTLATEPTEFKDVPASDQAADRADMLKKNPMDMSLIVDCSSEKSYVIDSELSLVQANKISKEVKEWDDLADYLSMAISEVKDHLFRLHKQKARGHVHFTVSAYQPLTPLLFAMLDLAGIPIDEGKNHKGFIDYLRQKPWFANFKPWMDQYDWKPQLKRCSIFQGYFYGMSEETYSSRCHRRAQQFQSALQVLYYYDKKFHGKLAHGNLDWGKDECKQWKDAGGYTIKKIDDDEWPTDPKRYGKGEGLDTIFNNEEPVVKVDDNYYTEKQLIKLRDFFLKQVKGDGSPVWNLKYNKRTGRGEIKANQNEIKQKVTSKDLKAELEAWKENTYNPQMAENKAMLGKFKDRKDDKTENEVWKRKSVEDEQASDKWSADIDMMQYHGKMVHKDKFTSDVARLDKELQDRLDAIEHQEKIETMEKWLTVLSMLQIVIGIATLGVGSIAVGIGLAIIDIGIEIGKAAIQFHYDKNYTMGKALREHTLGIIMDLASCVLLIPALFRIQKLKSTQKLAQKAIDAHEAEQARRTATISRSSEYSGVTTAQHTQISTGMPTEMKSANTNFVPIRPKGKDYQVIGMSTSKRGADAIPDDGALHLGSGLSNDKPTWVRIKRDNGSFDTLRIDNGKQKEWLKNHTGKDANEWRGVKKETETNSSPNVTDSPVVKLKEEAQASFSYTGANDTVTFDQLAKSNYNPQVGPSTIETVNVKYDEFTIPCFGDMLRYHGSGHLTIKPVKVAEPKAYHILKEAKLEEEFIINNVKGSITNNVTLFYVGYSTAMNTLQVVSSEGIPLSWAKENIANVIDGKKAEEIFVDTKN